MKRLSNIFVVLFALAAMTSCYQDEIAYVPTPTVGSNSVCFNVEAQWENEDEISRSSADCNRLGMHTAKSADGSVSLPIGVYEQEGICTANAATRGAKFDNAEDIKTLGMQVWANYTVDNTTVSFFPTAGEMFTWDSDAQCYVSTANQYLWPGGGTIDFVAITNHPENSFSPNLKDGVVESLTYTVPTDPTKQNDIIVATHSVDGNRTESYPLEFKHAMAAVNIKIGSVVKGEILSIKLTNIYNVGSFYPKQRTWVANNESIADFSVVLNGENGTYESDGQTTGNPLVHNENATFMMIPQNPREDAEMVIEFKNSEGDTTTLRGSIAGDNWDMGKTVSYVISIGEDFELKIEPIGKKLDAHYIIGEVRVTTDKIDNWEIRVSSSDEADITDKVSIIPESEANPLVKQGFWTDKVVDANGNITNESARGSSSWPGSGNVTNKLFYIFIPENITDKDREITITLKSTVTGSTAQSIKTLSQKYPNWTAGGFGWEVVDDDEEGKYGFKWTRMVAYVYPYTNLLRDTPLTNYCTEFINTYGAGANNFATVHSVYGDWDERGGFYINYGYRAYILLDYSTLNNVTGANSDKDGYNNTLALYRASGTTASSQFETILKTTLKAEQGSGSPELFRRPSAYEINMGVPAETGQSNDLSDIMEYIQKKNRYFVHKKSHTDGEGTALVSYIPYFKEEDLKWYLPAYGQFEYFNPDPNVANDAAANYWSSTTAGTTTAWTGGKEEKDRDLEYRVIAVRRDEKGYGKAAVTVDNSSIAGGENGSTNSWLE